MVINNTMAWILTIIVDQTMVVAHQSSSVYNNVYNNDNVLLILHLFPNNFYKKVKWFIITWHLPSQQVAVKWYHYWQAVHLPALFYLHIYNGQTEKTDSHLTETVITRLLFTSCKCCPPGGLFSNGESSQRMYQCLKSNWLSVSFN